MEPPLPLETARIARALARVVRGDAVATRLRELAVGDGRGALHIAVMHEPYLTLLLGGVKTVESRFSVNRVCPFEAVAVGDVLALKAQSGPLMGVVLVEHAAFYELEPEVWRKLRDRYAGPLCAEDPEFWREREAARYATLMRVAAPERIKPLPVAKRDRRGWVRLDSAQAAQQHLGL